MTTTDTTTTETELPAALLTMMDAQVRLEGAMMLLSVFDGAINGFNATDAEAARLLKAASTIEAGVKEIIDTLQGK